MNLATVMIRHITVATMLCLVMGPAIPAHAADGDRSLLQLAHFDQFEALAPIGRTLIQRDAGLCCLRGMVAFNRFRLEKLTRDTSINDENEIQKARTELTKEENGLADMYNRNRQFLSSCLELAARSANHGRYDIVFSNDAVLFFSPNSTQTFSGSYITDSVRNAVELYCPDLFKKLPNPDLDRFAQPPRGPLTYKKIAYVVRPLLESVASEGLDDMYANALAESTETVRQKALQTTNQFVPDDPHRDSKEEQLWIELSTIMVPDAKHIWPIAEKVRKRLLAAVEAVAEEKGIDLVLDPAFVYDWGKTPVASREDITADVVRYLASIRDERQNRSESIKRSP